MKYHPVAMECKGDFKAAFQEVLEGLFPAWNGPCRGVAAIWYGVEAQAESAARNAVKTDYSPGFCNVYDR